MWDSLRKRQGFKVLAVVLGILALIVVTGLYRFSRVCENFSEVALSGRYDLPSNVSPKEAIVVLTGDRYRIPKALELLRQRGSPLLIISGTGKNTSLTELVNQQGDAAVNIHESWKKIVLESQSTSTIQNAVNSAKILVSRGVNRVILVTSEYHMNRSLTIFRKVLPQLEIIAYPVSSDFTQKNFTGLWYFWLEYWKRILYSTYTSRNVQPFTH